MDASKELPLYKQALKEALTERELLRKENEILKDKLKSALTKIVVITGISNTKKQEIIKSLS